MPGSLPQGHSWDQKFGRNQNHGILVKIWLTDTYRSTHNSNGKTWKNTYVLINPEPIPKYSNPIKITWTIFMFDHFCRLEPPHYSLDLYLILYKSPFGFSSIFVWDFPFKTNPLWGSLSIIGVNSTAFGEMALGTALASVAAAWGPKIIKNLWDALGVYPNQYAWE